MTRLLIAPVTMATTIMVRAALQCLTVAVAGSGTALVTRVWNVEIIVLSVLTILVFAKLVLITLTLSLMRFVSVRNLSLIMAMRALIL